MLIISEGEPPETVLLFEGDGEPVMAPLMLCSLTTPPASLPLSYAPLIGIDLAFDMRKV